MFAQPFVPAYKIKIKYTDGTEYQLRDTGDVYIGFYHIYPNGAIYTGKSYTRGSFELIPQSFSNNPINTLYYKLRKIAFDKYVLPSYHMPMPNSIEREAGVMNRFFAQKINEPSIIIEIDRDQVKKANRSNKVGINRNMWNIQRIEWTISGDRDMVRKANHKVLSFAEPKIPGLIDYLGDLLEFHK